MIQHSTMPLVFDVTVALSESAFGTMCSSFAVPLLQLVFALLADLQNTFCCRLAYAISSGESIHGPNSVHSACKIRLVAH